MMSALKTQTSDTRPKFLEVEESYLKGFTIFQVVDIGNDHILASVKDKKEIVMIDRQVK
jgi:hypothetical protein